MSGVHKYPTISFRISPRERDEIEAKIKASGMQKKDYFVRSCIYNKVCVVGKKEVIYQLVATMVHPVNLFSFVIMVSSFLCSNVNSFCKFFHKSRFASSANQEWML